MNARDDGQRHQGHAEKGAADAAGRQRTQAARDTGLQQRAVGVVVVQAHHRSGRLRSAGQRRLQVGAHEAEAVAAGHIAKRRHMEHLGSMQLLAEGQPRPAQQIAMAFAEGVVDFHHDGRQGVVRAVAIPEADWLEGVAQHTRVAVQPDLAGSVGNALAGQQGVDPDQAVGTTLAMVAVEKTDQAEAVACQCGARFCAQAAHRQQQEISRIGKAVAHRPQAGVAHLSAADQGFGVARFHAASRVSARAHSAFNACATARPDIKPSS